MVYYLIIVFRHYIVPYKQHPRLSSLKIKDMGGFLQQTTKTLAVQFVQFSCVQSSNGSERVLRSISELHIDNLSVAFRIQFTVNIFFLNFAAAYAVRVVCPNFGSCCWGQCQFVYDKMYKDDTCFITQSPSTPDRAQESSIQSSLWNYSYWCILTQRILWISKGILTNYDRWSRIHACQRYYVRTILSALVVLHWLPIHPSHRAGTYNMGLSPLLIGCGQQLHRCRV